MWLSTHTLSTNLKKNIMNASDLVENWLKEQGFKNERDNDGDLHFKYQGANLYCYNDDNDKQF